MKVKPHYLVALIVAAIAAIFLLSHIVGVARSDAQYRAILKTYSDVLKPGMERSDVENYFMTSKYVSFDRGGIRRHCAHCARKSWVDLPRGTRLPDVRVCCG